MNTGHIPSSQRGMMLLEVLIGILIFAIAVLGMVKMQAVATSNSVNSADRATAALLADDIIAELWTAKAAVAPSDYSPQSTAGTWQYRVHNALRNGTGTLDVTAAPIATVTITWSRQLGRNAESGETATDATTSGIGVATYQTQVVIQ